jgi:hypothetical protein
MRDGLPSATNPSSQGTTPVSFDLNCAENSRSYFAKDAYPIPQADKPDF